MHRSLGVLTALGVIASAAVVACSSSSSGGGSCAANPNVSFANDIAPKVFQVSCAITSSCHGTMNETMAENFYIGPTGTTFPPAAWTSTEIAQAYGYIVGVPSVENPSMNFITPGNLDDSYLWQKVQPNPNADSTVTQGCLPVATNTDTACFGCSASTPCGATMPYNSAPLTSDQMCLLQNWIQNGAMNN